MSNNIQYEHLVRPDSCKSDGTEEANAPISHRPGYANGEGGQSYPAITSPTEYSFQSGILPGTPASTDWREPPAFIYETRPGVLRQASEEEPTTPVLGWRQNVERTKPVAVPNPNRDFNRCSHTFYPSCFGIPPGTTNLNHLDPLYYYKEAPKPKKKLKAIIEKILGK